MRRRRHSYRYEETLGEFLIKFVGVVAGLTFIVAVIVPFVIEIFGITWSRCLK
jgi:hypothetical protein